MNRKTFGSALVVAITLAAGLTACGKSESSSTPKTKNAALTATLVNGEFAPTAGGWVGDGFTLDKGCAANTLSATRPSLGGWTRASLTFGRTASSVRQEVVVPSPTVVTFEVTGNVRPDDPNAWFKIDLNDADEKQTTGNQTGSSLIKPRPFTLSVTTKSANEKVQVILSGSGKNVWKGCYGPVLTKAALTTANAVPPTTTSTTVPETTTSLPPTTTPEPTTLPEPTTSEPVVAVIETSTTVEQTTTSAVARTCTLTFQTASLSSCKLIKSYTVAFWKDSAALGGQQTIRGGQGWWVLGLNTLRPPADATFAIVTLNFADGSYVKNVQVPMTQTAYFERTFPLFGP